MSSPLDGGTAKVTDTTHHGPESEAGNKWLRPLLLAILAVALLWYLMQGCNMETTKPVAAEKKEVAPEPVAAVPLPSLHEFMKVKLPDGSELDAFKGGIEDHLVTFLNDANSKPGKDVWFDFDYLNFKLSTAEIVPESQKQLNNIIAILKAYPKVKIKIGGYTDKTGDEPGNLKLSKARAEAVKDALDAAGVGKQVEGAEGYGSAFAKAAADAPDEERINDRRVSVSVREK